jgi:ankyrin repeat protein
MGVGETFELIRFSTTEGFWEVNASSGLVGDVPSTHLERVVSIPPVLQYKYGLSNAEALVCMCKKGEIAGAQIVLAMGAHPTSEVECHLSGTEPVGAFKAFPLGEASYYGHVEMVRLLLTCGGIDLNQVTTDLGTSAFWMACSAGRVEVVTLLLTCDDIDANLANGKGSTPLHSACGGGHTEVVKVLLECNRVDVNQVRTDPGQTLDRTVETALFFACWEGRVEVVKLMLACARVDINQASRSFGGTPLFVACFQGHTEMVKQMLAYARVDVNKGIEAMLQAPQVRIPCNPLHAAAAAGHDDIADMLVEAGADTTIVWHGGKTPHQVATAANQDSLAQRRDGWIESVANIAFVRVDEQSTAATEPMDDSDCEYKNRFPHRCVQCAFFDRKSHSMMPLGPTPARLKRAGV